MHRSHHHTQGEAIYVFCVITRASTDPLGNTDMSFAIDGETVGALQLPPDGNATCDLWSSESVFCMFCERAEVDFDVYLSAQKSYAG